MKIEWRKLPSTEKLFVTHPYQKELKATIIDKEDNKIVLDKSIFYAEAGGQICDYGQIAGYNVVNIQKYGGENVKVFDPTKNDDLYVKNGSFIVHELEGDIALKIGDSVHLSLDWPHRYKVMKNHSAAHFLYLALQNFLPKDEIISVLGCYIDSEKFRFDISQKVLAEDISELENYANNLMAQGEDIVMQPFEGSDDAFMWRYGEFLVPCGGTHVKNAQELSPMEIRRKSKGKNNTRIEGRLIS